MVPKTEDRFRPELEEARQALEAQGRKVSVSDSASDESGISCNFERQYSFLPTIRADKWN